MSAFTRLYDGRTVPLDMVYLDANAGTLTVPDVTLTCSDAREVLSAPSRITATFDDLPFPLSGADYLTPVTGALVLTFDPSGLTSGIYTHIFFATSGRWQGLGRMMWSRAGFGASGRATRFVAPLLYVSVYALTVPSSSPLTVPTSSWR